MKFLALSFLLLPVLVFSQQKTFTDSLLLRTTKNESVKTRITAFNKLAWEFARTDSARAMAYAEQAKVLAEKSKDLSGLANYYRNVGQVNGFKNNLVKSLAAFKQSNTYFSMLKDENEIASNYNYMGMAHKILGLRQEAVSWFKLAEPIHKKLNKQRELSVIYGNLGSMYTELNEKVKAIEYYLKSVAIFEKSGEIKSGAPTYTNLGNLLRDQKNPAQAEIYYKKAIAIIKTINDPINLGIAYLNYAILYVNTSDYTQAKSMFYLSMETFEKGNFKRGVQICYNNLGAILLRQEQYKEAIPLLEKSIKISEEARNFSGLALVQQNIGYGYMKMGQLALADEWYDRAEISAKTYKSDLTTFGEIYNHRSMNDSAKGDFKSAFDRRVKYMNIKDSLLNAGLSKQINELNTKYETEKKQKQIELLNKQTTIQALELNNQDLLLDRNSLEISNKNLDLNRKNILLKQKQLEAASKGQQIGLLNKENTIQKLSISRRNTTIAFFAGVLFLLLLMTYLLYNRYKLRQNARLQAEIMKQQDLATKAVIEAEENERTRIAGDLHDGVGQLFSAVKMNLSGLENRLDLQNPELRLSFEKTLSLVDESCKEVRSISHQMAPNVLLKSGLVSAVRDFIYKVDERRLKINLEVEGLNERMDTNTETVLFRIIQETINNVIKHAGASHLDIQITKDQDGFSVMIEDDGKGFDTSKIDAFDGIGLKNMQTRAEYLKGKLHISSTPGSGTLIHIWIPVAA